MRTQRLVMAALVASAIGCARPHSASRAGEAATPANPDLLTAAELSDPAVSQGDAMLAVRRLRPKFLATRGTASIRGGSGSTLISVNEGALQPLENLSRIRVSEVVEIRYLSATSAALRFGASAESGAVLMVKTR